MKLKDNKTNFGTLSSFLSHGITWNGIIALGDDLIPFKAAPRFLIGPKPEAGMLIAFEVNNSEFNLPNAINLRPVLISKNGEKVIVSSERMENTVVPFELLVEAINGIGKLQLGKQIRSKSFSESVGKSRVVPTSISDDIVYAQTNRKAKQYHRFVRGRDLEDTDTVTLILEKYPFYTVLKDCYFGTPAEPWPWDMHSTPNSKSFWESHAFVFDPAIVKPGTEQKDCPW